MIFLISNWTNSTCFSSIYCLLLLKIRAKTLSSKTTFHASVWKSSATYSGGKSIIMVGFRYWWVVHSDRRRTSKEFINTNIKPVSIHRPNTNVFKFNQYRDENLPNLLYWMVLDRPPDCFLRQNMNKKAVILDKF